MLKNRIYNKQINYKTETIDEKIWREAESKDIAIKEVETILKENSIDCVINKNANINSPISLRITIPLN